MLSLPPGAYAVCAEVFSDLLAAESDSVYLWPVLANLCFKLNADVPQL